MGKDRLTIPTPNGPRKVYCGCDGKKWTAAFEKTICPVSCIGCWGAFVDCNTAQPCAESHDIIYRSVKCYDCGEDFVVFKNKEDEV